MRAVQFSQFGDPSVLHVADRPDPGPPQGDEVLVQVAASSINGTDLGLRRGDAKIATWGQMPFTPGFDVAGTVVGCGPRVTAFSPGDRVMALLGHKGGGQADRVLLRQRRAALIPRGCSWIDAAAIPLAGLTALQALHRHGRLGSYGAGARVLVIGASGGIGSFAVQLAKLAGAHVTGVSSGSKVTFVAGLGADEVIDRHRDDVAGTAGHFHVILDSPARFGLRDLQHLLTPDGVFVTTRPLGTDALRAVPARLRRRTRRWAPVITGARPSDLAHLGDLVVREELRPNVDRSYPMADVADAHRHAEGPATGKVVLDISAT
ncbi:NADP-dependent oxidoreductase [Modestobacter sp. VKM Ac-2985]|uniref:NADP-dependent oxidoreductase n=1 Tax=Modestobacter sp. VKM Ac-2985 TaxID=3004139 RepID=UPI0022AB5C65|nr:NADP-dependent oxidoreductase [Modestobacter sp. VKM Ac-2985]MCZ2836570.1 NADP-dependent oxidoreductase [Modestobacter sp. VKM Ac-2985]